MPFPSNNLRPKSHWLPNNVHLIKFILTYEYSCKNISKLLLRAQNQPPSPQAEHFCDLVLYMQ